MALVRLAWTLLVVTVLVVLRWSTHHCLRWWRSTKAPEQPQVRPSDRRRAQAAQPTAGSRGRPPNG